MTENKKYIPDPEEGFDGNYVITPSYTQNVECKYDIRAFLKYKRETGVEWDTLSAEERKQFLLPKYS